jgi:perosamine synthetase
LYIQKDDISGNVYGSCLSLPCSSSLTPEVQHEVIKLLKTFYHD